MTQTEPRARTRTRPARRAVHPRHERATIRPCEALPEDDRRAGRHHPDRRRTKEFVETWRNASYNCYLLRAQVLPRGLPGHAGDPERIVDADRVPRQRRRDGAGATSRSPTWQPITSTARSAAPASCAARTRCSPATSTGSGPGPSTWSRRSARSPSTAASTSSTGRPGTSGPTSATHEPVLGDDRDQPGAGSATGRRAWTSRSAARRCCSSTARPPTTGPPCRGPSRRSCSRPATSSA